MTATAALSRRELLAGFLAQAALRPERIIDLHQHTHYHGRTNAALFSHQKAMGVSLTVLLPAGSQLGLEADVWGNDSVLEIARERPKEYVFFANELPTLTETKDVLEKYLKLGARGIGEQKFPIDCDSRWVQRLAAIAQDYQVPVLLHFQHGKYNDGFVNFYKVLEKYPKVNFIGHAQTWWGNIDARHDQSVLYPKGKVTPGGLTDRWLADYPNIFGDLSAGSGLSAMQRDEEFAAGFLNRHQNKLLYGSDCADTEGTGQPCSGWQQLAMIRKLVTDPAARDKILYRNTAKLLKIG